ncbi:MAG TPA: hypothetical protein VIL60_02515 [Rhodanobacter sp.]
MKFESVILASLSFACIALCVLVMAAMLIITPASVQLVNASVPVASTQAG